LKERGLIVLRNEVFTLNRNGSHVPLVIVGLDDEWSGHINPERAFKGVSPEQPIICLNHNPANAKQLLKYPWQWMLAGHTHGRQVATSRIGKALYPHRYRHYTHGYYSVEGRHLYVNKGLSYGQRVLDWCRPEVTVFKLAVLAPEQPIPSISH
jgi:predicted MPP superfamily phosphohydrolase